MGETQVPLLERRRRARQFAVALQRSRLELRAAERGHAAGRQLRALTQSSQLCARLRGGGEATAERLGGVVVVVAVALRRERRRRVQRLGVPRDVHRQNQPLRQRVAHRRDAQQRVGRVEQRDDRGQGQPASVFIFSVSAARFRKVVLVVLVHGALHLREPGERHGVHGAPRAAEDALAAPRVEGGGHEGRELVRRRRRAAPGGASRHAIRRARRHQPHAVDGEQRRQSALVVVVHRRGQGDCRRVVVFVVVVVQIPVRVAASGKPASRPFGRARSKRRLDARPPGGGLLRQDQDVQRRRDASAAAAAAARPARPRALVRHRQQRSPSLARGEGRHRQAPRDGAPSKRTATGIVVALHGVRAQRQRSPERGRDARSRLEKDTLAPFRGDGRAAADVVSVVVVADASDEKLVPPVVVAVVVVPESAGLVVVRGRTVDVVVVRAGRPRRRRMTAAGEERRERRRQPRLGARVAARFLARQRFERDPRESNPRGRERTQRVHVSLSAEQDERQRAPAVRRREREVHDFRPQRIRRRRLKQIAAAPGVEAVRRLVRRDVNARVEHPQRPVR
mmetsp:Transcript_11767/g.50415  ORF Transcript_11767/g.50415 Transcript_11767/m.50415 type:complete len:567 (+) Transcript_11767:564-2264(+)